MGDSKYPDRTIRNDLGGPLCADVHRLLNGLYSGSKSEIATAIVELLRSNELIDRHTREAIANAVERDIEARENTTRLRVMLPTGSAPTITDEYEKFFDLQEISDEFARLRTTMTRQQAIGAIEDSGRAKRTKIEEALAYSKRARFRLSRSPR
jgi:hypothetical protein